jgi:hypothetical protein
MTNAFSMLSGVCSTIRRVSTAPILTIALVLAECIHAISASGMLTSINKN